ncbi:hypothetical protein L1987_27876 [Smallanthus sonchifolius]|uniref:Uncharacterized protein n=1 Tax=Smallanthus sonchifolius TaxID=185202 RepID=A0ACB9IEF7_9ASTR|nr:hypothetical protein L1987_27876 [Smallanthus sonchifolius]
MSDSHNILTTTFEQFNPFDPYFVIFFYIFNYLSVYISCQTTGPTSQFGVSTSDGHYVPAVAGGTIPQPRPTQPLPMGSGDDLHAYHMDDEEMMRLKAERGGKAGGWSIELSRKRALEEAFWSIWI